MELNFCFKLKKILAIFQLTKLRFITGNHKFILHKLDIENQRVSVHDRNFIYSIFLDLLEFYTENFIIIFKNMYDPVSYLIFQHALPIKHLNRNGNTALRSGTFFSLPRLAFAASILRPDIPQKLTNFTPNLNFRERFFSIF